MENVERVQAKTAPEIMLPRSQEPETKKLLDIVAEQAAMLEIVPMTLKETNAFVEQNHRHHGKVVGHKFSISDHFRMRW